MHENAQIAALLQAMHHPALPVIDLSLTRVRTLLERLGNPHMRIPPVIHFAGTNGKGSTLAFLKAIYEAAGLRVHAYTSPHLVRFNERITLAGNPIDDEHLLKVLRRVQQVAAQLPVTFFEATTAAAFLAFSETLADILLLETGLGGRLDATNVVPHPLATAITPIGFDHREFLGDTVSKIAAEKAGILKPGAPCFIGVQLPEALATITDKASENGCPLHALGREWQYQEISSGIEISGPQMSLVTATPSLAGAHQYQNAALAAMIAATLLFPKIDTSAIAHGIAHAHWPGRLQRLTRGPLVNAWGKKGEVYLDGGHNPAAAAALAAWIRSRAEPVTLLWGMMQRKDAADFLAPLTPYLARAVSVSLAEEGSYSAEALAEIARMGLVRDVASGADLTSTTALLQHGTPGTLLVAGSLYLAGEVLKNHS